MSTMKEGKVEIETGQVYIIKEGSAKEKLSGAETIKIGEYYKEAYEKHKIRNMWKILIKNESGEWVPPQKFLLFGQQIEAHYNLEFEPLTQAKSRLEDLEDI